MLWLLSDECASIGMVCVKRGKLRAWRARGAKVRESVRACALEARECSIVWVIWTWRAKRGRDARIWCKARESVRAQGARMRDLLRNDPGVQDACMLKGLNILSTSTPSYEQGAGSAHVRAREAYGRGNTARICACSKVIPICIYIKKIQMEERWTKPRVNEWYPMKQQWYMLFFDARLRRLILLLERMQVEGAPMGGAVRGVEAPYKLIGCARCARLGAMSREFDYIGQTCKEQPFLCECAQMLHQWAVRMVYQGAIGA
ncbi:hypothetical protein C8R48DRAFT_678986 [Suillus tomentosus]|nr:hypothetical protein C8R48DRAFT_678986 [Suillus tomentosus]